MAQPVLIRYTLGSKTVEIPAQYAGGMEGSFMPGVERGAVRLVCHEPLWRNIHETAVSLSTPTTFDVGIIAGFEDGAWSNLSITDSGAVYALAYDHRTNRLYVGGFFTDLAGIADADYVAFWDGSNWNAMGTGADNLVYDLQLAPSGDVYAFGKFSTIGGVSGTGRIGLARWDGSSWNLVSDAPLGSTEYFLAGLLASDGNIYVGGAFIDLAGDADADYIAMYDGSTWTSVGGKGGNGSCGVIKEGPDGKIYFGGNFSSLGGDASLGHLSCWDGSSWASPWSDPGGLVYDLDWDSGQNLYIASDVTNIGGIADADYVAKWNGESWQAVAGGLTNTVRGIRVGSDGTVYVVGDEQTWGGIEGVWSWGSDVAILRGGVWHPEEFSLSGASNVVYAVELGRLRQSGDEDVYVGFLTAGTATVAGGTTSVSNEGSAPAFPVIEIKRSGGTSAYLGVIRNDTTNSKLIFDLSILDGETITIDTEAKTVISDHRGSVIDTMLPSSDFQDWALLPGTNDIYTYISTAGSPTITANMMWRECFWSVDDA